MPARSRTRRPRCPLSADRSGWARPGAAAAVLLASSVLVADQRYVRGEGAVVEAVNGWPRAVGRGLELVMPLGTLGAALVLTAVVAVAALHWRAPAAVLLTAGLAWRADNLLKELIERPRPAAVLDAIVLRDAAATGFGFPSGHTAMAFALAAVLHRLLPRRWRWVPWVLATAVGLARIYVGAHFPMDVVGGAALGMLVGGVVGLIVRPGQRRPG